MTEAMKITLSTQPADARWGEKATYSINNDGITLHLNGADDLGLIQRAARKIDGLGIKHVQLSGEGWDADRCSGTGRKYSFSVHHKRLVSSIFPRKIERLRSSCREPDIRCHCFLHG